MTIIDRYILIQFFKIFLISFASFVGLYVVIHVFTNLDEVVEISGSPGGWDSLVFDFYGPRVLDFFNRTAGILVLVASVFSIAMMQRRRESTATEAAGITKARLVRPVIFAAIAVIAVAAVSRELYIPKYKAMLVRSLTNWTSTGTVSMHHQKDAETGLLIKGDKLIVGESTITKIKVTLPRRFNSKFVDVDADKGIVLSDDSARNRPSGILLQNIQKPKKILQSESIDWNERTVVFTPVDYPWLKSNEIFVACRFDVQEMAFGENLFKFSSLEEMIESLKKPSRRFGMGEQVAIHQRVLKPILELTLILIGLPLVISDPNRNLFLGAAICTMVIVGIETTAAASHAMGAYRLIQPAALSAWIPVIVFLPLTAISIRKLFD